MVGAVSFSRKPYAQWRVEEVGGARNQDMATAGPTRHGEGRCEWRRQMRVNGSNHAKSYHDCQRRGPFHVGFTWVSRAQGKRKAFDWLGRTRCAGRHEKTAATVRRCFVSSGVQNGSNERGRVPKFEALVCIPQKPAKNPEKRRESSAQTRKQVATLEAPT